MFREIRTHEKITDRTENYSKGFDIDKRVIPATRKDKREESNEEAFAELFED